MEWWGRRAGVRVRSALAAAVVVAVALAVGAVVLVLLLDRSLSGSVRELAQGQAQQLADDLAADPSGALARDSQRVSGSGLGLVQVVAPDGRVVSASPQLAGRAPLLPDRPPPGVSAIGTVAVSELDEEPTLLVVARGVHTADGDLVVLVGRASGSVERATQVAIELMLAGVPLLAAVAALASYAFVGRSLRPVEAIRAQVSVLTERDLGARVPVPAAHDEVRRLADTMNAMLARLDDAQRAQRRFVADASHELRSPITTIGAALENLEAEPAPDPAVVATLATLRAETDRLAALVADLLLLARADERDLAPRRDEVDLDDLVDDVRRSAAEPVGGVRLRADAVPVRVLGDRRQLARVTRNLVDNAVRHAASSVLVRLHQEGADAVLEVADDGPGVPAADRERIFERFVRLDGSRTRTGGGAGLGLAIVAEVVRGHGGTVTVGDRAGGGAVFTVRLPLAQPGGGSTGGSTGGGSGSSIR